MSPRARIVLDTSVIVGLLSSTDVHHAASTAAVRRHASAGDELLVPASVYTELLVGAMRLGPDDVARIERFIASATRLVPLDAAVAAEAAQLRARHLPGLRLPDALVLGTAIATGAATTLTTDRALLRYDPRVHVIS